MKSEGRNNSFSRNEMDYELEREEAIFLGR
jgi:hypothetical protein